MNKPYVIGIAGGSASGKSTFADALENSLNGLKVKVLHMDSYFKPENQRPYSEASITGVMYMDDNHPDTMDLAKLRDDMVNIINRNAHEVVIAEGLLTLHDKEICNLLDLKLYVECRPDERIVRRLKRNMQYGLTFDQISGVYLDMVRYRHDEYVEPSKWKADFILNGSSPSESALEIIVSYINTNSNYKNR